MDKSDQKVTPPEFPKQLITEPLQANPAPQINSLGPLSHLIGTWTNQNLGTSNSGGISSPYSYNLMPLPSFAAKEGYILKNFKYYEEITFSPINGNAPNRGGNYNQNANVIFYEQRIYFAEGPDKDKLVHAENGSWLFLNTAKQPLNAYSNGDNSPTEIPPSPLPQQNVLSNIVKQISVPHGNSILAQGGVAGYINESDYSYEKSGPLQIGNYADSALPDSNDADFVAPYHIQTDVAGGNPYPALNEAPNHPLQESLDAGPCVKYIEWSVDTKNPAAPGSVTNIPFEQKKAKVVDYKSQYWLQATKNSSEYDQLAYNQTILMDIPIAGKGIVSFPHVTCNVLTKKIE